jgi:hypothetical protein
MVARVIAPPVAFDGSLTLALRSLRDAVQRNQLLRRCGLFSRSAS